MNEQELVIEALSRRIAELEVRAALWEARAYIANQALEQILSDTKQGLDNDPDQR